MDEIIIRQKIECVEKRCNYKFKNKETAKRAIIHQTFFTDNKVEGTSNFKELACFGDSVLGFCVTDYLFNELGISKKGTLNDRRKEFTNNEYLLKVAEDLKVEECLLLGKSILNSKERINRVLASSIEALIGAIFIDGGYQKVRRFVSEAILKNRLVL